MNCYKNKTANLTLMLLTLFYFPGLASAGEINKGYFGDLAIDGYDPVAYFTEQRAMKGSEDISHNWLGAEWAFSSEKHKKLFSENPVKYAPQYGGYCADGIAYGDITANIDPEAWRIIDGKLYLNYDQGAAVEIEELEGQLEKSVQNWPEMRAKILANSD